MLISTETINTNVQKDCQAFIEECENSARLSLEAAAKQICTSAKKKPLILISGPSGSGKTTTAIKLFRLIRAMDQPICYISMDKYFKDFTDEERRLKQQNKIDLEAPERLDSAYLNTEIKRLLNGETIELPAYSFATNTRSSSGKKLSLNGGFVILEGIHALNPNVLGEEDDCSTRIYVSVRSRLIDSQGNKLHPSKIRLMRRMMRDKLYRSRRIEETVRMYASVQRGENRYILPYKSRSDLDIDTFIPYEASIYKSVLFDELSALAPKYADIRDIVHGMEELLPVSPDAVPGDALIREFIGGSQLKY